VGEVSILRGLDEVVAILNCPVLLLFDAISHLSIIDGLKTTKHNNGVNNRFK